LATDRPVMNALRDRLVKITEGRDKDYEHWITRVAISN